jgi:transcriptional regulator with XRE-family HTH domain
MKKTKQQILAELNKITQKSPTWLEEAQDRVENQDWLEISQRIALKILRTLRAQNKTQLELARALSVSPQQVSKWVKGKENFTVETISKIEAALGCRLVQVEFEKKEKVMVTAVKDVLIEEKSAYLYPEIIRKSNFAFRKSVKKSLGTTEVLHSFQTSTSA